VQTPERQENLFRILGIEASPIIGDGYNPFLAPLDAFNLNTGRLGRTSELQNTVTAQFFGPKELL
jgi:hypothetical protein